MHLERRMQTLDSMMFARSRSAVRNRCFHGNSIAQRSRADDDGVHFV
jgi:hypothetical protein